jgi:hypothetical protein
MEQWFPDTYADAAAAGEVKRFAQQRAAGARMAADQDAAVGRTLPVLEVTAGKRQIVRTG